MFWLDKDKKSTSVQEYKKMKALVCLDFIFLQIEKTKLLFL